MGRARAGASFDKEEPPFHADSRHASPVKNGGDGGNGREDMTNKNWSHFNSSLFILPSYIENIPTPYLRLLPSCPPRIPKILQAVALPIPVCKPLPEPPHLRRVPQLLQQVQVVLRREANVNRRRHSQRRVDRIFLVATIATIATTLAIRNAICFANPTRALLAHLLLAVFHTAHTHNG